MPQKFYRTKSFKTLNSEWAKKLEQSGFEDVEYREDMMNTHGTSSFFLAKFEFVKDNAKEEYYRLAGQFLYSHEFESERLKDVWALHCEGVSMRDIHDKLKNKHESLSKSRVHQEIFKLATIMLLKAKNEAHSE